MIRRRRAGHIPGARLQDRLHARQLAPRLTPTASVPGRGRHEATINLNITPLPPGTITGTVKFSNGTAAPIGTPVSFVSHRRHATAKGRPPTATATTASPPTSAPTTARPPRPRRPPQGPSPTSPSPPTPTGQRARPRPTSCCNEPEHHLRHRDSTAASASARPCPSCPPATSATTVQTTADGTYTSQGLPAGTYTVTASATINGGFYVGQAAAPVTLTAGIPRGREHRPAGGAERHADRHREDNYASHAPINGVTITVTRGSGTGAVTVGTATTGANGATTRSRCRRGSIPSRPAPRATPSQTQTLSIPIGQTTATLNFTLTVLTSLTGAVHRPGTTTWSPGPTRTAR